MSQIHKGIFGAFAIAVSFGAIQLAFGHDLMGSRPGVSAAPGTDINRAAKADRAPVPKVRAQTQTISLRPDGLADTSVLVRVPVAKEARNENRERPAAKPGKINVACEPPVSVLTEVAKLLQPAAA
jgi:hypothetical protein